MVVELTKATDLDPTLSIVYRIECLCDHHYIQGQFNFDFPDNNYFVCDECQKIVRNFKEPIANLDLLNSEEALYATAQ